MCILQIYENTLRGEIYGLTSSSKKAIEILIKVELLDFYRSPRIFKAEKSWKLP
jgi:hypothetical protein